MRNAGDDYADAIYMATDAACGLVLDYIEEGRKPPKPSDPMTVKADEYENGIVSVIMLDIDAFAEKWGHEPVTVNCTIPLWLKSQSERNHFDYSEVLREALIRKLDDLLE